MKDAKYELPRVGNCKVMKVIVSRNRMTTGKPEWQQNMLEVFTLDGFLIASEERALSCEGPADVIQEAINTINELLSFVPDKGPQPNINPIIEKLQALIIY